MSKKIIKVDLSIFFDDERKMSYVFVDPNWKTVECLQRRVELLFEITSVWFLSDGCFLPPKEPIEILQGCDIIKAFVLNDSQELRKKKKLKKLKKILKQSENVAVLSEKSGETENANNELLISAGATAVTSSIFLKNKFLEEFNQEQQLSSSKNSDKLCKKRKHDNNASLDEKESDQQLSSSKSPINRSKKRKSDLEIMSTTRLSKVPSSTLLNERSSLQIENNNNLSVDKSKSSKNPFKNLKSSKAHIYFDETGDILSPTSKKLKNSLPKTSKKSGTIVIFHCQLTDVDNNADAEPQKPRIFNLKCTNETAKPLIEIQEDILIPTDAHTNVTQKSNSSDEATIINDVEKVTNEEDGNEKDANETFNNTQISFNSTMARTEIEKQISSENLNSGSKTGKTNTNESVAIAEVAETSNLNKAELSCIEAPVSVCIDQSEIHSTTVDKNDSESQMELTCAEDRPSKLKDETKDNQSYINGNSVESVDCVDLSIDLDDEVPLKSDNKMQHELTADGESSKYSQSDVEEVSEIIDLNESEYNYNTSFNNSEQKNTSIKEIKVDKILPMCRNITDLPRAEDIIIFKIPYKTNKTYACTNFVAGKVEYVNKRTKNIRVLVLDGISELCHAPTHFRCNLDDSLNSASTYLQIKLADVLEPKLFSMS